MNPQRVQKKRLTPSNGPHLVEALGREIALTGVGRAFVNEKPARRQARSETGRSVPAVSGSSFPSRGTWGCPQVGEDTGEGAGPGLEEGATPSRADNAAVRVENGVTAASRKPEAAPTP